ncbi:MAG: cardiolipin synthase [Acidobacteria bacterium]|nr:MAG: cardiolipin synthase [Acidobacteriota bacterium]REK10334.1 MAG: cardiolipin synthase [Acidobacteriota bacterium]
MTFALEPTIAAPIAFLSVAFAVVASAHAVLTKRDVRAAIGWVVAIWVAPLLGSIAYAIFGINLIRRRAVSIFGEHHDRGFVPLVPLEESVEPSFGALGMTRFVDRLVNVPLVEGNEVVPLLGCDAFEQMLDVIGSARESLSLETYIFDHDATGRRFVAALAEAVERGVEVRVLIDAVGARYSKEPTPRELAHRGVRTALFLPTRHPLRAPYLNLRNHRKVLVADGRIGFTGGLNIRHCLSESDGSEQLRDTHFRVEGPVVAHLQRAFVEDWYFSAREELLGPRWFPELEARGEMLARGIPDGPDRDLEKIQWTLLGALACAKHRVKIVTPYFLPINGIDTALQVAARRGVHVDVFLPERGNLLLPHWASRGLWENVLEGGCRVWLVPPPFDHSKLMIVDNSWSFVGSANWDPRSLRLNFEFNVEVRSAKLNLAIDDLIEERRGRAKEVKLEAHRRRPVPERLLDGAARLLSPYL